MRTLQKILVVISFAILSALPLSAWAESTFDIAHFREQGNDIIMVIVPKKFDNFPSSDKQQVSNELQQCAKEAKVSGKIVLVWNKPNGAMGFFGPTPWHPFLKSINMAYVKQRVNKELTCDD